MRMMLVSGALLWQAAIVVAQPVDYSRDIKPILKERCFACHGGLKQEAELRLDTAALMSKGGDSGPAIKLGDSDNSLLVARVSSEDESERMPPEGMALSPEQITQLRDWIDQGAIAPENEKPEEAPQEHWAFKPIVRPLVPTSDRGVPFPTAIDALLAVEHNRHGLSPLPSAERHALLRRVYLDLIGLPPTREELQEFLADDSPDAYQDVVTRLLDSPEYGERWARHWMDVWRYSDWYGRRYVPDVWNSAPQVWRWRDWIVRSLNADHGYDRMLQEMLAGDEIDPENDEAGYATGYLIRNWYALNPNDWMRNTVEHTGKAFLGLTFNCAHCHDHKYDPIAHEDYFRLRAFFEPIYIRQDRVPGEADPGPFQDYNYSTLRKVQPLGSVRVFDKDAEAVTWFYTGGDERNRVQERGSISPGVPAFLAKSLPEIEPIELPPRAWYPGLRPAIQATVIDAAKEAIAAAEQAVQTATQANAEPSQAVKDQLAKAEMAFAEALQAARQSEGSALVGQQSLFIDATTGRRTLQNRLDGIKRLDDGFTVEFQLLINNDAHFNFQFAKDVDKGLTAGYVAFDQGRIVSYQPNSFREFDVGAYDFAAGQQRFHVKLLLQTKADSCLLTVRSLSDDKLLVEKVPVALNGWNPVGDPTKAITFDARTGSVVVLDELILTAASSDETNAPERVAHFDFEPPNYPDGRDVAGLGGWEASSYSVQPATSIVSMTAGSEGLRIARQELEMARRAVRAASLPRLVASAQESAARAELASVEARIGADRAKYGETPNADVAALTQTAVRLEREATLRHSEAAVLMQERTLAEAEAKPADDAKRAEAINTANTALAAARAAVDKARTAIDEIPPTATYTAFSPTYPQTSTGRRKALAQWITNRDNPLTARVAVNHIWMRHFHSPLVASVNDFGRNGDAPTHPDLLDWLAVELMESGWSMKHLHRVIVSSAAYRRTSAAKESENWLAVDPENKLLWRMNAGRMEAEVIRDSLLYAAGQLDRTMGGQPRENSESLTTYRRSLYYSYYPELGGQSPLGELFDGPNALECYRRTRTVIPQQALALTNSDLVHTMSTEIVKRWEDQQGASGGTNETEQFVIAMFGTILSRMPSSSERTLCLDALDRHRALLTQTIDDEATITRKTRESLVRALFSHNDFVAIR
ncbi:MAG: PSD1 domain-containing protein [Planctomycetales bacterium]|nr:PSD1 domain-containing protein [Planctomycetales bacterium]